MPEIDADILDEETTRLELTLRTHDVLAKRFGPHILVRELAMLSEEVVREQLLPYHRYPQAFVADINIGFEKHGLSLGMSWTDLPPSKHAVVRNPQQMIAHVP